MNILRLMDELEHLVEASKGFMGKRMVEEEAFFHKVQQLRTALPQALKDAQDSAWARDLTPDASASLREVAARAHNLSRGEKLNLIAQLSAQLARDET